MSHMLDCELSGSKVLCSMTLTGIHREYSGAGQHDWQESTVNPVVQASVREEKKLTAENAKLKQDIEDLKKQLLEKERKRGGRWHLVCKTDSFPPDQMKSG